MRRIAALLCVGLLLFGLVGCGGAEDSGGDGEEAAERVEEVGASGGGASQGEGLQGEAGSGEEVPEEETAGEEYPAYEWGFDDPEHHGMDGAVLDALHGALEGSQIYASLIVRDGVIVDEYYREGYDEESVFPLNSCSKSFTSALIGIALDEGLILGVDVPISDYFPEVAGTGKEGITIRHLLEHTSGIWWDEFGAGTAFWGMNRSDNWVDYVLGQPMESTPGAAFSYTTGGTHLLAAILEQAAEETMLEYADKHLFTPLGMDSVRWRADPQGILDGGNGIEMTMRDAAKFGQLFLEGGSWNGMQLVPGPWVAESTGVQVARSGNYGSYGYQWWIRQFAGYDTFYAMGAFGQFILVAPELNLVAVLTSDRTGGTDTPYRYISDYILAACE